MQDIVGYKQVRIFPHFKVIFFLAPDRPLTSLSFTANQGVVFLCTSLQTTDNWALYWGLEKLKKVIIALFLLYGCLSAKRGRLIEEFKHWYK